MWRGSSPATPSAWPAPISPTTPLTALAASTIEDVTVIGRRGPAQSAFSAKEILSLVQTPGISVELAEELELDPVSAEAVGGPQGSLVHYKLDLPADLPAGS